MLNSIDNDNEDDIASLLVDSDTEFGVLSDNAAGRKGMPSFPADKDMSRGEMKIFRSPAASAVASTAINVVKWIDNKAVHVITSANSCEKVETVLRRVKGKATKTPFPCRK